MPIENVTFTNLNLDAKQGFTVREARNVAFHNVQVNTQIGPAVRAKNAQQLRLDGLRGMVPAGAPLVELGNVADAFVTNCFPTPGLDTFLKLKGADTRGIVLQNNYLKSVKTPIAKGEEVKQPVEITAAEVPAAPAIERRR